MNIKSYLILWCVFNLSLKAEIFAADKVQKYINTKDELLKTSNFSMSHNVFNAKVLFQFYKCDWCFGVDDEIVILDKTFDTLLHPF